MDGVGDNDDDARCDGETADGGAEKATAYDTATMLQCEYSDLYGNPAPMTAQMTAAGERERSPALAEADAKRVETDLLGVITPPPQDF